MFGKELYVMEGEGPLNLKSTVGRRKVLLTMNKLGWGLKA